MTSGPYFHAGGDEVKTLTPAQYQRFIERVQAIVQSHGKQMIGWDEVAAARLAPTSVVQHWRPGEKFAVPAGVKLIVSPANKAYLDMKYHPDTALGLNWAGYVDVPDAYTWDPSTVLGQVPEDAVLGVEAPLWSETLTRLHDIEYMAFPRLAGVAEIGWSPATGRTWDEFSRRLGAQAQRWSALGVNAYWSPRVPWRH